ncbi:two-component system OmpR family response regulator [Labrys wisconsinensis]|uniref:Two-component system OmpR family response regulator n=2 Tax=Labrys wisconsinensis TaxID=425677 RepID=A0ABU0JKV4_9HYPH|nr:two-component system OmpR family response regulator [Labrys wisconsinensis]
MQIRSDIRRHPMHSPHIAVVEDDHEIRALVARYLAANDCRVSAAEDGRDLDRLMAESRIDLVVLDLMLPGEDGLSICRRLRSTSHVPIIMLTARSDDIDRIVGLEIGADDYMGKPFNPRELLARIRSVLRRGSDPAEDPGGPHSYVFAGWHANLTLSRLTNPVGERVAVTSAEFALLRVFCERSGRILSRGKLMELTQGRAPGPHERSIDILVSRLRRKIEPDPQAPSLIRTVRAGGYMFTPHVTMA